VFVVNGHTAELFTEDARTRAVLITYHNFAFVMALGAMWALLRFANRLPRIDLLALGSFAAFNYYILVSGGRIGLLIVIAATLTTLFGKSRSLVFSATVVAAFIVVSLAAIFFIQNYAFEIYSNPDVPATLRRLVYYSFIQGEGNNASETRDVYFDLAVDVFLNAPMLGVGWGGFPVAAGLPDQSGQWPHNLVLELLSETGIVGASLFAIFLGLVAYDFMRHPGDSDEKIRVLIIFAAGFAASMVGSDWTGQRVLFFAIGAMAGYATRHRDADRWAP
jgi:O-antigen ligase